MLFEVWSWLPWVMGLGSLGWIALALLAPGLLSAVSPLLRGAAEGLVEFCKILYEGLTDILDSWKTIATVAVILVLFANYWTFQEARQADRTSYSSSKAPTRGRAHAKTKKESTAKRTDSGQADWGWAR